MSTLQKSCINPSSYHKKKKIGCFFLLGSLLLLLSFLASLLLGATTISWGELGRAIIDKDISSSAYRIICYVRLPRAVAAILAGAALCVSGVILQTVLNNALASPNIIGVNAGAGFASLLIIGIFPHMLVLLPMASMIGAFATCLFVYAIAAKTGASRMTITLAGIAISTILTAGMNTIKTIFPDSIYNASSFLMGGFSGITFQNMQYAWILILIGLVSAIFLSYQLDVMLLGEEIAMSLGVCVKKMRLILLLIAAILAGSAISFAGLISFVGLIVPHIVRRLVGNNHIYVIGLSIFGGGSLVVLCDLISRCLFAPYEIPVGIILSFLGGPFFLYLLMSGDRRMLS